MGDPGTAVRSGPGPGVADQAVSVAAESSYALWRTVDRRSPAADLRVLLITQGTYPYQFGGVSTWCRNLIAGLPEVDFHVLALVADPDLAPIFTLPDNVSALTTVPLWGIHDALEIRTHPTSEDLRRAHRLPDRDRMADGFVRPLGDLVTAIFSPTADPRAVARDVAALYRFFLANDFDVAMRSTAAWDAFAGAVEAAYPSVAHAAGYRDAAVGAGDVLTGLQWLRHWLLPLSQPLPVTDVAHATMAGECVLPAVAAKYHHGAGLVFSEHGVCLREVYLREAPDTGSLFLKLMKIGFALRTSEMAFAVADQITTCCDYNKRWTYGHHSSRVRTMYYGVDTPPAGERRSPQLAAPVITWLGRFDPLKDVETLLRAAAIVHRRRPDAVFRLYGSASPDRAEYYQRMLDLRDELGLGEAVELPGYTSNAQQVFGEADIVVLSSISEGFPYATLEAMACGKPIVATDVGGLSEQLGGAGVLVNPQSPEPLAAALITLIDDPQERVRLGAAAGQRARTTFSMNRMTGLCAKAYAAAAVAAGPDADGSAPLSVGLRPRRMIASDRGFRGIPREKAIAAGPGPLSALDALVLTISTEVPYPVDDREIAAVLETMGVTDSIAYARFGVSDTFALATMVFAKLARTDGRPAPRPHRLAPGTRVHRIIPRVVDGVLMLIPLAVLVAVFVWASSIPGWSAGIGEALLIGMAASSVAGIAFRGAVMRRGALLVGCGRWSATRRFLWRWSCGAVLALVAIDLAAIVVADRLVGHVSADAVLTFGVAFAALVVLWVIGSGLEIVQRPHEIGLAMLAGAVVAVVVYLGSGVGPTVHAEIAVVAGYLATIAIIAVRVSQVLGGDDGHRATPRLPRLMFLLREAAPYAAFGALVVVIVLAPSLVTALHAMSGGGPGWRSAAVGMTFALVPPILAIPIAEDAPYGLSQAIATVCSDATVPETGAGVGTVLSEVHRRYLRRYAICIAVIGLAGLPVVWLLAETGALTRFGVTATGTIVTAFAISAAAYLILALAQLDLMGPLTYGSPRSAVRSALAGMAAMTVVGLIAFPIGGVMAGPVSLLAGAAVMAFCAVRASRRFFAHVTEYLIGAM